MFVLVSMTMSRLNVCKRFYLTADCGKIRPWRSLLSLRSHSVRDHIEEARRTLLLLAVDIISLQLSPEKSSPFFHSCFTNKCQRAGVLYILECIYFLHFFSFFLFLNVGKTVSVGPDVCLHTKNKKDLQLSDRNYSCSCKATN